MFWTKRQNGRYASLPTARKPLARSEDLIIQEVEDEVLVYDSNRARAHCLSADAGRVWQACDGHKDPAALSAELFLPEETVLRALAELEEKELLDAGPELSLNGHDHSHGHTRRDFGFKAAKVGAAVATGPMIYSIVAPTALATVTTPEIVCNFYSGKSCDACAQICGCCCCCQGCSKTTKSPACKMCSAISTCPTHTTGCADQLLVLGGSPGQKCTSGPNCSDTAKPGSCQAGCIPCTTDPSGFCPSLDCHTHDCNCFGQGNPCATI